MKKISVIGATLVGSSSAVRSACIASSIPRQRFVIVRRQGGSRYRATANTREHCWRPPQTGEAWILWPRILRPRILWPWRSRPVAGGSGSATHL